VINPQGLFAEQRNNKFATPLLHTYNYMHLALAPFFSFQHGQNQLLYFISFFATRAPGPFCRQFKCFWLLQWENESGLSLQL